MPDDSAHKPAPPAKPEKPASIGLLDDLGDSPTIVRNVNAAELLQQADEESDGPTGPDKPRPVATSTSPTVKVPQPLGTHGPTVGGTMRGPALLPPIVPPLKSSEPAATSPGRFDSDHRPDTIRDLPQSAVVMPAPASKSTAPPPPKGSGDLARAVVSVGGDAMDTKQSTSTSASPSAPPQPVKPLPAPSPFASGAEPPAPATASKTGSSPPPPSPREENAPDRAVRSAAPSPAPPIAAAALGLDPPVARRSPALWIMIPVTAVVFLLIGGGATLLGVKAGWFERLGFPPPLSVQPVAAGAETAGSPAAAPQPRAPQTATATPAPSTPAGTRAGAAAPSAPAAGLEPIPEDAEANAAGLAKVADPAARAAPSGTPEAAPAAPSAETPPTAGAPADATPSKVPGRLSVRTNTPATVSIDDGPARPTPVRRLFLPAGRHKLVITTPDGQHHTENIEIQPDRHLHVDRTY